MVKEKSVMKRIEKSVLSLLLTLAVIISSMAVLPANAAEVTQEGSGSTLGISVSGSTGRATYNDVFASLKGKGYTLNQARNSASSTFTKGDFVYVWAYVHDTNNVLYKKYSSGTCNMTLSIIRPNGTVAYTYTYKNSDNNWIGQKLDIAGTWKIQSKISGSIYGTNTRTITVKDQQSRNTYNDVFASPKGKGYNLSQAKAVASKNFTKGQFVYVWGYVHDSSNNLYKNYSSGSCNMTLSLYRPNGSCAYTYTYNNSDNNWIGQKLDTVGTWKIQSKITGSISGTNTQTITVKDTTTPVTAKTYYVTAKSGLILRQSASASSTKILTIPYASAVTVTTISNGWAKATYGGKSGYCSSSYLSTTKPSNKGDEILTFAKTQVGKKYGSYSSENFHYRAWCADFVSYCARKTGCSYAVPTNSSVDGIRTAIKNKGGKEYSKALIQSGSFTPKTGDIIIFKSSGASHVGIVSHYQGGRIYYVDGNNTSSGNGYNSCVHYSNCSAYDSKLTCVLRPNY